LSRLRRRPSTHETKVDTSEVAWGAEFRDSENPKLQMQEL